MHSVWLAGSQTEFRVRCRVSAEFTGHHDCTWMSCCASDACLHTGFSGTQQAGHTSLPRRQLSCRRPVMTVEAQGHNTPERSSLPAARRTMAASQLSAPSQPPAKPGSCRTAGLAQPPTGLDSCPSDVHRAGCTVRLLAASAQRSTHHVPARVPSCARRRTCMPKLCPG